MLNFVWPWLTLVLPLPWLVRCFFSPINTVEQAALKVPFIEDFEGYTTEKTVQDRQWSIYLAIIAWSLLVLAATRPQWLGEPIQRAVSGRDLMPGLKDKALGARLAELETKWIESGFSLTREELLS